MSEMDFLSLGKNFPPVTTERVCVYFFLLDNLILVARMLTDLQWKQFPLRIVNFSNHQQTINRRVIVHWPPKTPK